MENAAGSEWLKKKYNLYFYELTHTSYIGTRQKIDIDDKGNVTEFFPPNYAPRSTPLHHIEFLIKYDNINLDFLKAVFDRLHEDEICEYIRMKPKGIYERKIAFLYEFLMGKLLPLPDVGKVNYIDLLDNVKYVTGKIIKNSRWNINDNLLGTRNFCPIIRKLKDLEFYLSDNYNELIEEITNAFPVDIFYRAVNYLYTKETRSSYQIEKEKPSLERINRFVKLLEKAGKQPIEELLSEVNLTSLQNEIAEPRYGAKGYRDFQNYIGQTTFNFREIIHYICPPPQFVASIMSGLVETAKKSEGIHPIARASVISFGFVFTHPFEDGNGRLHRFLIHDVLTRDKLVNKGIIIPVSAHMVNHIKDYDTALEAFSVPLMQKVKYELMRDSSLIVTNDSEIESYFRYPDLTEQTIYLAKTIKGTIIEDIYQEMDFLVKYDEVKSAIQEIVDMPDRNIDLMIRFLHQNKGMLALRKRKQFAELSDIEIEQMENVFREVFELNKNIK